MQVLANTNNRVNNDRTIKQKNSSTNQNNTQKTKKENVIETPLINNTNNLSTNNINNSNSLKSDIEGMNTNNNKEINEVYSVGG